MVQDCNDGLKLLVKAAFERAVEIIDENPTLRFEDGNDQTLFKDAYEQTLYLMRNAMLRTTLVDDFTAANIDRQDEASLKKFINLMTEALKGMPDDNNAIEAAEVLIIEVDKHIKNKPLPSNRLN